MAKKNFVAEVTFKVSYFLFLTYVEKFAIYHDMKGEFTAY